MRSIQQTTLKNANRLLRCLAFVVIFGFGLLPITNSGVATATVWRNELDNEIVRQLAMQQQFSGTGSVVFGGGTGVAIAPGWVLTVAHVAGVTERNRFVLDGETYFGTSILHPQADLALLRLDQSSRLPASTAFIAPNFDFDPVDNLVWKSGNGRHGSRRDSNNGALITGDGLSRAGTNIVTRRVLNNPGVGLGPTDVLAFSRPNTPFDVTTAPGDSGGPMFLQVDNQWVIAGVTVGVSPGTGFIDTDIASYHGWIEQQTGLTFAPTAGPTELFFDSDFTRAGVQSDVLEDFDLVWDNFRPFFTGGDQGYSFTWENDFAPTAVFGTSQSGTANVRVQAEITHGGIRFDPTSGADAAGGFQLTNDGGALRAAAGGATIEVNQNASISASLVGNSNEGVRKTGNAELVLKGDNQGFAAPLLVEQGTLTVASETALGAGGPKTTVGRGGTLQLVGADLTLNETLELNGRGAADEGALKVTSGQHVLTQQVQIGADTMIHVAAEASLVVGASNGGLANSGLRNADGQRGVLTQAGVGTVAYEGVNQLTELEIAEGFAVGGGIIFGLVTVAGEGELRPGDSVDGAKIGSFQAEAFSLEQGGVLTLDLDPALNQGDRLLASDTINLAGDLNINFLNAPEIGQEFSLIELLGAGSVLGQFANVMINGSSPLGDNLRLVVNYAGGSGNDIVLIATAAIPEPNSVSIIALLGGLLGFRRRRAE